MKHYFSHDFFLYMYMYLESFSYIMMYAENINWLICMCSFRWNVYLYVTFLPHYRSFVSTILAITVLIPYYVLVVLALVGLTFSGFIVNSNLLSDTSGFTLYHICRYAWHSTILMQQLRASSKHWS